MRITVARAQNDKKRWQAKECAEWWPTSSDALFTCSDTARWVSDFIGRLSCILCCSPHVRHVGSFSLVLLLSSLGLSLSKSEEGPSFEPLNLFWEMAYCLMGERDCLLRRASPASSLYAVRASDMYKPKSCCCLLSFPCSFFKLRCTRIKRR